MPGKRIPPSERISKEIMGIIQSLEGHSSNQKLLGELMQLSMRKFIQELLEKEIHEHIGKAYYQHGDDRASYRNGQK